MARTEQIIDAARSGEQEAASALEHKATQLEKFIDDVDELVRRVTHLGDEDIAKLRSRVETSLAAVRNTAARGVQSAVDGTRSAARATDGYVRSNPWTAVGVAAAAGVALGFALRRR